jgi:L-fuconolactonase
VIDAHFHIWDLTRGECTWPTADEGAIHRTWLMPDFAAVTAGAGIAKAILVQSQENAADTDWLLEQAATDPLVCAIVGWADLTAPDAAASVATLAAKPKLAGLRPMVQDKAPDWYDDPALDDGFRAIAEHGLRIDALVRVQHLASLDRLANRFPDITIVIDHAAKPRIGSAEGFAEWRQAIAPLADRPNLHCKLSGLLTECPPGEDSADSLRPYCEALLSMFGAERLMWGSDWPVLAAVGDYSGWLELAKGLAPHSAHHQLFEASAVTFYGLKPEEGQ